ncbi:endopeptidase La [Chordicoccus furentiruminis]|uniref:endopeptidase La n=1 Tax=Chordicoccus furentiruminis TaxID=2709410 RepID=UPI0023A84DE8|nr:endopeptidase La [Chordicoccus furentiruminis]
MSTSSMILAFYNTVLLPDVEYRLSLEEISEAEKSRVKIDDGHVVLMPLKEAKKREELTADDFYALGVEAEVLDISEGPMGTFLHARTRGKVRSLSVETGADVLEGTFEPVEEVMDVTYVGEKTLLDTLKKTTTEVASKIKGGDYAIEYLKNLKSVNEYAAVFCQFFDMTAEEKYELLETGSFRERGKLILEAVKRFKGAIDLQVDLQSADDPEGIAYKKAAIKKQMNLLEKELKEMEPEREEDEDSFEKRIEASGMPDNVRKEVERVLRRFEQEPTNGAEYNSLYNYLDFVTTLKWKVEKQDPIDLKKARKIMDRDHYGLDKVKERILQHLAVMSLNENADAPDQKGSILLLVGAPGTGKTSMGRSVAEALGRKYVRISLGGIRDEAEIRGHRRTYIGAMPGRIMEGIKRSGSMNPVVVLDEVDKIKSSFDGDPSAALLEALDPEQNATFEDHYVDLPYDLSHVFFICTANTWDTIPQPLLDRMEVIELAGYTPAEHFHIAKEHLVPQALHETGLSKKDIRFTDGALRKIISDYTMEAGVRGLKKQLLAVCRKAAVRIVEGRIGDGSGKEEAPEAGPVIVREKNLEEFLGRKKVSHDRVMKANPAGVVTGLAWTQAGGEILFIESVAMNGTGQIHLTGQIGDVMKESAETAVSLVRSMFMDSGLDFAKRDIHIHIPEGAVPKDGPSAGITMFTAVTSLVTGIPVDPRLAMTGEISLRGQVLPIGGLPEKLMAANRAGIRKVLIPKENARDLEDVPEEVRRELEIISVSTVRDVIREALHVRLPEPDQHPFGMVELQKVSVPRLAQAAEEAAKPASGSV